MLISLATAKMHLRVDGNAEDALITIWCLAAESSACEFLNRNVYPDAAALNTAIAAVPLALVAAGAAYQAALTAAALIDDAVACAAAVAGAGAAYRAAQQVAREAYVGMVTNPQIEAAMLLTLGHLYENREDVILNGSPAALPMGAHSLLQPFRVGLGV